MSAQLNETVGAWSEILPLLYSVYIPLWDGYYKDKKG